MRFWFLLTCLFIQAPAVALAEQLDDDWHYSLLFPMIWAPDIKGDIRVGNDKYKITIPFDEKIKDLDTGIIGEFYLRKGNWIGGVKLTTCAVKPRKLQMASRFPVDPP